MGDTHTQFWQEIWQGVSKALVWLWYITIGVVVKIALDTRTEKLTLKKIFIKVVFSVFVGWLATIICIKFGYIKVAGIVVPVATLMGESLVLYFMANWKSIFNKLLPGWFKFRGNK